MSTLSFGIVIPTLNSEKTLPETLSSISSQIGSVPVHVHVQDGASTDKTVSIAHQWFEQLPNKNHISFSLDSQHDSGPAEALHRGFQSVHADVMAWIGADDLFLPNAFVTIHSLLEQHPRVHWVTGLAQQIDEAGVTLSLRGIHGAARIPSGFAQRALARGSHANLITGFIQQEGTFWTSTAWLSVEGKIATDLKRAFDFDLWCRMAAHHELVQVTAPLAVFRRRVGQLSEDRAAYQAEVFHVRDKLRRATLHRQTPRTSPRRAVAFFDPTLGRWVIKRYFFGPQLLRRIVEGTVRRLARTGIAHPPKNVKHPA